jgi:hypothetical protein
MARRSGFGTACYVQVRRVVAWRFRSGSAGLCMARPVKAVLAKGVML